MRTRQDLRCLIFQKCIIQTTSLFTDLISTIENIRALSKAIEENKEIIDDSTKSDNEKLKAERALSKSKERLLELLPEEARERVRASNYSKEAIERELNILIHCKKKLHFLKTSYKPLHSFKENLTKICQYSLPFFGYMVQ